MTKCFEKSWFRWILIVWLAYHLLSTASTLIPEPSPLKNAVAPLFFHYQRVTGTDQGWNMFTSIANHRGSNVSVIAQFDDGTTRRFGAIVPGLTDYSPTRTFRHHSLFDRFFSSTHFVAQAWQIWGQRYQNRQKNPGFGNCYCPGLRNLIFSTSRWTFLPSGIFLPETASIA